MLSSVLELRIQEMASMGIGNQPFMDVKPSDQAPKGTVISDRACNSIIKGTGTVASPPPSLALQSALGLWLTHWVGRA